MAICPPTLMKEKITMGDLVTSLTARECWRSRWFSTHHRRSACPHSGANLWQHYFYHLAMSQHDNNNADGGTAIAAARQPPPALHQCTGRNNWQSIGNRHPWGNQGGGAAPRMEWEEKPGPPDQSTVQPLPCEHRHASCFWPIRQAQRQELELCWGLGDAPSRPLSLSLSVVFLCSLNLAGAAGLVKEGAGVEEKAGAISFCTWQRTSSRARGIQYKVIAGLLVFVHPLSAPNIMH